MDLSEWLDPGAINPRLVASSKRQALTAVAEIASRCFGQPPAPILEALLAREGDGSTGVGAGVALPHARVPNLTRLRGVFVRLEAPVAFEAVDDLPVDLIFALFAPPDAGSEHLRALARVSRLLRRGDLRAQLRQARGADAVHAILLQEASSSAA